MKKFILLSIACALFTSCTNTTGKMIKDEDNGKNFTVKSGDVLEVRLAAQLSTGFSWKIAQLKGVARKGDSKIVTQSDNVTGGQDVQIIMFTATEKGQGQIELHYLQPWKEGATYEKKFMITLTVE